MRKFFLGYCFLVLWTNKLLGQSTDSIWTYKEPTLKPDDAKMFGTLAELGHQKSSGNAEIRSTNALLGMKFDTGLSETREDLEYQYLVVKGVTAAHRVHSYTGYDYYLGGRFWGYILNDYEYNETKKIKFSLLTGAGIKYDLLRNDFWLAFTSHP
ncbi:MAG: DUF481 domain-containing protein [Proteobacteria bacterium]|nr:DUF481 domain-containing protein [Pseudomonadota bacterium]